MPAYSFEALDNLGQTRKGVLEADTARAARSTLRSQALVPLRVEALGNAPGAPGAADQQGQEGRGLQRALFAGRVLDAGALAIWTRQLAGLVSASLPLERALTALSDEAEDPRQRNLVAGLRAEVNAGSSFAKALSRHPREFSPIYVGVIDAGEHSGNLGLVLERLADDLAERQVLKAKLLGAALYPAIVTLVAIVIVSFLVAYVVPQVANVFAGTKKALPWLTVAMLGLSSMVRSYGVLVLTLLALVALVLRYALKNETLRQRYDAAFLKLP